MHLCFIVEGYPTPEDPFMPFIRELVAEMVKQGVDCTVIAPQSVTRAYTHKLPVRPKQWMDRIDNNQAIRVFQPCYLTFSNRFPKLNRLLMAKAIRRAYRKITEPIDALYAHFWHMGVMASKIRSDLPVFVACGESRIEVKDTFSAKEIDRLMARLKGVVYVGTKSLNNAREIGLQKDQPYIVAPNGYNEEQFRHMDRAECRKALRWPQDAFILSFVGSFNRRKGVDRLSRAIKEINDEVYSCFIGSGEIKPDCDHILFCGKAAHEEICRYLNASDVFVLPTNNEGCCNAIVEALACGLPVVSSNQSFNDDILDNTCSIRIDPMNISEIERAVLGLMDKEKRNMLSEGALQKTKGLTISKRTENILNFITSLLGK